MLSTIAIFEIRRRFAQLSTYVYFLLFLGIGFLVVITAGGAFPTANLVIGGSGGKTLVNSPFVICILTSIVSYFGMTVMAAFMGQSIYQDFHHRTHTLFFTAPITKTDYIAGRFLGSFVVLIFVFSSIGVGSWLATKMPFVDAESFGPDHLLAYVQPYLLIVVPNMLFIGVIFFSLAALARKIMPVYVASVLFLIGYMIATTINSEVEWKTAAALADPFGLEAISRVTEYWTVTERNTQFLPFTGVLFWNRVLWVSIAGILFLATMSRFRFAYGNERTGGKLRVSHSISAPSLRTSLTHVERRFRPLRLLPGSIWLDFKETIKNVYFAAITLAGAMFVFLAAQTMGSIYGTETYPVTAEIVEIAGGSFTLFILVITTFYAGELVWRERDINMNQLQDVLPIPNWLPLASKLGALGLVQLLLMAVVTLCGILIQAGKGYWKFELPVYFVDLFMIKLCLFLLLSVLAVTVHVTVNHKYLGHFVMVLYYLSHTFMDRFGFELQIYDYAGTPGYTYSDMNGFGHFLRAIGWFDFYWGLAATLLAIVSHLLWVRGTDTSLLNRIRTARQRLTARVIAFALFVGVAFSATGSFIYYNTVVLNSFKSRYELEVESADYEREYKKFASAPQPRVTDVRVQFDIDPERRSCSIEGRLTLKNKTTRPIDTIFVNSQAELRIKELALAGVTATRTDDTRLQWHTFSLSEPLLPGAICDLVFSLSYESRGFRNRSDDTMVVGNGTFLNSQVLPSIGYLPNREISDDRTRRKHHFEPKERMAEAADIEARANNYISHDADWVTLDATVSTNADQIAIIPGYLQREWVEGSKRFFHYRTEGRILHFFSVLSARYEVRRDQWRGRVAFGKPDVTPLSGAQAATAEEQDVSIEIYYQRGHEYNLDRMIAAIKDSLDYFTVHFSPYQHRQVRIVEFPRYSQFAQSFPNTIPFSESIGFIARVDPDDPESIDYPYYVTAHEIAHQWWAHQVIGGNVRGSTMLSESFAQYSALMVMKRKFGAPHMRRFLKFELDRYLIGRGIERKKELPLAHNENQGYVHYNKGSLVMYALQDYLGEDVVNRALAEFIQAVGYQEPPYTNSLEFLNQLRRVTPPDMQYLIVDLFETITLFDNRTKSATYSQTSSGDYEVTMEVETRKMRADEQGVETDVAIDDWIDVGVLDAKGDVLALEKRRVTQPTETFTLTVKELPVKAGIDPLHKLIDRRPDDNTARVSKKLATSSG